MPEASPNVRALLEQIAKWVVDEPDQVFVDHLDDDVIELEVAEGDVGKIIGRQGRNVRAECGRASDIRWTSSTKGRADGEEPAP